MTHDERVMEAVQSVTVELANILDEFWDHVAIVGGLAVYLLVPQDAATGRHRGTVDVDLVLNHERLKENTYLTIHEILIRSLYQEDGKKAFRWHRSVTIEGETIDVPVDFLAPGYGDTRPERDYQEVEEILALKARGAEMAFIGAIDYQLAKQHPDGGSDRVVLHVAAAPALVLLKGLALTRDGDKDAYDIIYLIRSYPGGAQALASAMRPYLDRRPAQQALDQIRTKFGSREAIGVLRAAREMARVEGGEMEVHRTMAYELVHALLDAIDAA